MKRVTIAFFALFIIVITGCATTSHRKSSGGTERLIKEKRYDCATTSYRESSGWIERLIKEKRYGRALDCLSKVAPGDPDFSAAAARHKEVKALASRYEHDICSRAQKLIDKGSWDQALDLYDEALPRLPKSMTLKKGLGELRDRQRMKTQQLEWDKLLVQGDWIIKSLPIYREIARVNPRDKYAQTSYQKLQNEAEQVAQKLEAHGTDALDRGDGKEAWRFLALAVKLNPTASVKKKLARLEHRKREAEKKRRLLKQRKQEKEAKRWQKISQQLARYDKQVEAKDYLAARRTLAALEQLGYDKTQIAQKRGRLEQMIATEKNQLFSQGVREYSRGRYENAVKLWREVIKLDPYHEQARENLARAERVLHKLEELRKKESF